VYIDAVHKHLPKLVTTVGILCVVVGVGWGFIDYSHSEFGLYMYAGQFLLTLAVGILLSSVGTLMWAQHFEKHKRLKVAGCIFVIGVLAATVGPNNVHGPGMLLVPVALSAWILSIILVVMAIRLPSR
jgi:hypothetical protein